MYEETCFKLAIF